MLLFFSTNEILMYLRGNKYNESVIFKDLDYDNKEVYNVSDTESMTTFQVVATDQAIRQEISLTEEVPKYLQFYFMYITKSPEGKSFEKVPAI